jgi:hypothetical protein
MGRPDTLKLRKEKSRTERKTAKLRRRADRKRQAEIAQLAVDLKRYTQGEKHEWKWHCAGSGAHQQAAPAAAAGQACTVVRRRALQGLAAALGEDDLRIPTSRRCHVERGRVPGAAITPGRFAPACPG